METPAKTPVEIVQELIAIHTTRKEACDKLNVPENDDLLKTNLSAAKQQSDQFISELMNELSNFGDAVQSVADRENEYQSIYKQALTDIGTMTPQQHMQTFQALEDSLKKFYQGLLETNTDLPDSVKEIVNGQKEKLSTGYSA